ncbi:MAG: response regulator transcription factor [Pseudomonadota bacterium]
MVHCAYIAVGGEGAPARVEMLRQHQIAVDAFADAGSLPDEIPLAVLDGTAMEAADLEDLVRQRAASGTRVLALFQLGHGQTFRARREALLAAGAEDVMEADAPAHDLVIRTRALLLGARVPFVLVVEDNEKTGPWALAELRAAGLDGACVTTLADARQAFEARMVDALVVDRTLPDGDGLAFVAFLRSHGIRTPALLFTARDGVSERIDGLNAADDYVCKPVHGDELVARVQVLLRPRHLEEILTFGPLELVRRSQVVRWRGERVHLRPKECDMLIYLAERQGQPIPKRMIYADVWDKVFMDVGSNPVTAARHRLVRDLKAFLEARGETYPEFLETETDAYCFRADPLLQLPDV